MFFFNQEKFRKEKQDNEKAMEKQNMRLEQERLELEEQSNQLLEKEVCNGLKLLQNTVKCFIFVGSNFRGFQI